MKDGFQGGSKNKQYQFRLVEIAKSYNSIKLFPALLERNNLVHSLISDFKKLQQSIQNYSPFYFNAYDRLKNNVRLNMECISELKKLYFIKAKTFPCAVSQFVVFYKWFVAGFLSHGSEKPKIDM